MPELIIGSIIPILEKSINHLCESWGRKDPGNSEMEVAKSRVRQLNQIPIIPLAKFYFVSVMESYSPVNLGPLNNMEIVFPLFEIMLGSTVHSPITLTSLLTSLVLMPQALSSIENWALHSIFMAFLGWFMRCWTSAALTSLPVNISIAACTAV